MTIILHKDCVRTFCNGAGYVGSVSAGSTKPDLRGGNSGRWFGGVNFVGRGGLVGLSSV